MGFGFDLHKQAAELAETPLPTLETGIEAIQQLGHVEIPCIAQLIRCL